MLSPTLLKSTLSSTRIDQVETNSLLTFELFLKLKENPETNPMMPERELQSIPKPKFPLPTMLTSAGPKLPPSTELKSTLFLPLLLLPMILLMSKETEDETEDVAKTTEVVTETQRAPARLSSVSTLEPLEPSFGTPRLDTLHPTCSFHL